MKIISKDNKICYEEYKREALILKELRYPGIPIIYDLEETKEYLYIIEEYLEGETLYERINSTGVLVGEELIEFAINLCNPIIYLHTRTTPILHLDIHPGNIVIKDKMVGLIDFDHARYSMKEKVFSSLYGNKNFSAPEQFIKKQVDKKTDVYAIGAIIYYAATGYFPSEYFDLPLIIGKDLCFLLKSCLNKDFNSRIEDVVELKEKLLAIAHKNKNKSSHNIAIVASSKGLGATYLSLGLVSYFRDNNISSIYEEYNNSGDMKFLLENYIKESDEYGSFKFNNICISPSLDYKKFKHSASIYIKDYGTDLETALSDNNDCIILICASSSWKQNNNTKYLEKISKVNNYKILYNFCTNPEVLILKEIKKENCYKFPYIANIMENTKLRNRFFSDLLKNLLPSYMNKKRIL